MTGVIDTYALAGRLPGAKVRVALPALTVPPAAAVINTEPAGGGPRPLPGVAAGSLLLGSVLVSVVAPSEGDGRTVSVEVVAGPLPSLGPAAPVAPTAAVESDVPGVPDSGAAVAPELEPAGASVVTGPLDDAAGSRTTRLCVVAPAEDTGTDVTVLGTVAVVVTCVASVVTFVLELGGETLTLWTGVAV